MSLNFIGIDKPFKVQFGDAALLVKPITPEEEQVIRAAVKSARRRGDMAVCTFAVLHAVVVGWENVMDQDGEPVPFDRHLLWCLLLRLLGEDLEPEHVLARVLRRLRGAEDPLDGRSGRTWTPSSASADGRTPMEC